MAKFCTNCGTKIEEGQKKCTNCGKVLKISSEPIKETKINETNDNTTSIPNTGEKKSRILSGLLAIFIGSLGVHNFYLGYTSKAVAQLLLTLVGWIACGIGPLIASVWGFVEGIMILTGSIDKDANGNPLVD